MIRKKVKILVISFLFLVFLSFLYLLYDYYLYREEIKESSWDIPRMIEYESIDNYKIRETPEGKFVVNENAGLEFFVPHGWDVEKRKRDDTLEIYPHNNDSLASCYFWIGIDHYLINDYTEEESRPRIILDRLNKDKGIIEDSQMSIEIDNYLSLKTIKDSTDILFISIETPINNAIYNFLLFSPLLEENEKCLNYFNNLLETISIDI